MPDSLADILESPEHIRIATDLGNTTVLQRPAFKLRAQGFEDSPIEVNANFYVMCVG